jgi:polyisoprenoid-binding protein YceI
MADDLTKRRAQFIEPQSPDVFEAPRRWLVDAVGFTVETALGLTIHGHFDRVGGSYEVGSEGTRIELVVDATSVDTGNGISDGLLQSADSRRLKDHPHVRFTSTRVREAGDGTLAVEGYLEAVGKVQSVAFDADAKEVDHGRQLEAAMTLDRQRLSQSAERFAVFLPATVHITAHLSP